MMNHKGGMVRNLAGKAYINDEKKYDSVLAKKKGEVPTHLSSPKMPDGNCSSKKVGTVHARRRGEECGLEIAFQREDNSSYYSGVNNTAHLQHSDTSSDLIECMSEESVNMKPRTPSLFLKNTFTFEQNSSFIEDGPLESTLMVYEVPSTLYENAIFIDDMPWACSDGSAVMELVSPSSALESVESTLISLDHNLEGSSMEFEVTQRKMISISAGELINHLKESSNRSRSLKQENMRKCMASAMVSSSKDTASMKPKEQKRVNGLKVDEKQKRELPMLWSSLPVKNSLLGRVKAKKVDAVAELRIKNEKAPTLARTVKSVKPKQAGVIPSQGSRISLSPIIIKKNTLSPPKRIQLTPKPTLSLKMKSSVVKYSSPALDSEGITRQSSQENSRISGDAGMSKLGKMKISKQFAATRAPKSTVNHALGFNNRKLRSLRNQVEAGNVDGVKEKTLHVVDEKLVGVALKSAEQKQMKLRSHQSSRTLSSSSSISSSAFLSSSFGVQSGGSQLKIIDACGSKKSHIGERKGRRPLNVVEQKLGVALKSAEQKLRFQQSSGTLSSRSSISSSVCFSSGYKKESDGSRLTISDASESKKTHFSEREGRTSLHTDDQKLFGVAVMSVDQRHTKLRSRLSSRTSSSRSSISTSASVSSNYEENDEFQLIINNASGSKKTLIPKGNRKTPLYSQKDVNKKIQKRTENVRPEDKSLSFENLSFRRGKEVSPPREIPDQRALIFMQEKIVSEAGNFVGETGMSSFTESRESTTACFATVSPGSPTVVLRQQAVQEKNTKALFDYVIEETANKLVETRKSKGRRRIKETSRSSYSAKR